jgi:hypothetical protein
MLRDRGRGAAFAPKSRQNPANRPARNAAVGMTAYSGLKFIATPLMQ